METSRKPKVSVLLPAYNGGAFLDETITSVLSQTFTDFVLVIVDDHSTDNTEAVVQQYLHDPRVIFYRNEQNIGVKANWNRCLELARGEYIKFICSDDKFHPQILEKFVPVLDAHPGVSLVGCYKEEFGGQSILWKIPFDHLQPGKKVVLETVKNYNYLGEPTCVMFRKSDVQKVGPFRNFVWIIDWEMYVRLLSTGDCYIVPERLCFTRNHPGQVTKMVWKHYIHLFEEYQMFSNIRNGVYGFRFTGEETKTMDECLEKRRWRIYNTLPEVLRTLGQGKSRKVLAKILTLAAKEQYLGTLLKVYTGRVLHKWLFFRAKKHFS